MLLTGGDDTFVKNVDWTTRTLHYQLERPNRAKGRKGMLHNMDGLLPSVADRAEMPMEERSPSTNTAIVCLNFKVPLRIRQQFKIYAARHNCTMTELLMRFLDEIHISDVGPGATNVIAKQAMQK
jgi:hypothetical protein